MGCSSAKIQKIQHRILASLSSPVPVQVRDCGNESIEMEVWEDAERDVLAAAATCSSFHEPAWVQDPCVTVPACCTAVH